MFDLDRTRASEQHDNKHKSLTNSCVRRVYQFDLNGNVIKLWNSIATASEILKIGRGDITRCCRDHWRTAGGAVGLVWRYYDDVHANVLNENWLPIPLPDWKDYLASDTGKIKKDDGHILNGRVTESGYIKIGIQVRGRKVFEYAHRLIAYTFLGLNDEEGLVVNHKNLMKHDNRVENLEIITLVFVLAQTRRENMIHAVANGARKTIRVSPVDFQNNVVTIFNSISEATRVMSIARESIIEACENGQKVVGGYRWQYAN